MKKFILVLIVFQSSLLLSQAQSPIEPTRKYEGMVEYQKTQQHATILDFNYPERDLEKALESYLEHQGSKVKTQKGFNVVKSVKIHEKENRYYDVYYKVEGSGKGDNARSSLFIILAEPGENILLRDGKSGNAGNAAAASVGAVSFFGAMGSTVGTYDLDKKIKEQEDEVSSAERKQTDMQKKKERLEKELNEISQDITKQSAEVDKARTILDQLKGQKKKD